MRTDPGPGDRGSMPVAMLLTLVGMMLSGTLVTMLLTQTTATSTAVDRAGSLHAAQAGLDGFIAQIRAAESLDGGGNPKRTLNNDRIGSPDKLPCGTLSGAAVTGGGRYRVTIDYLDADPRGVDDNPQTAGVNELTEWVANHDIACPITVVTPRFALLRSLGTDRPGGNIDAVPNRTLRGTYTFRTSNENIAGGQFHSVQHGGFCLDAAAATVNTQLQIRTCDATRRQQEFAYNKNLSIVLVSSQTTSPPLGLCVDIGALPADDAVTFTERPATLQACATATAPQQVMILDGNNLLIGTNAAGTVRRDAPGEPLGSCLWVKNPGVDPKLLVAGPRPAGCTAWEPDPSAGAGAAGAESKQVVNYDLFGRCVDVNSNLVAKGVIVWPCKQAPDPAQVDWNQVWDLPVVTGTATTATGPFRVLEKPHAPNLWYCLQWPLPLTDGSVPVLVECNASTPARTTWVRSGETGDEFNYQIATTTTPAKCLAPLDPTGAVKTLILNPCDGSTLQKWNAPPDVTQSQPLKDYTER